MSSDDRKDPRTAQGTPRKRRAYMKPAFKHERVFETMALSCGKITSTGGPCSVVPKAS